MNNLRKIREENNITIEAVSEATGYTKEELEAYENGKVTGSKALLMDLKVTEKLAEKLNISIDREVIDTDYEQTFCAWFDRMIAHDTTPDDVKFLEYNQQVYGRATA